MVTRDSPWTDDERALQDEYDRLVCSDCGNLRSVCSNPLSEWYPQLSTCYAVADRRVAERRLVSKHKGEPGLERHELDGVGVWVSEHNLTPEETAFDLEPQLPRVD